MGGPVSRCIWISIYAEGACYWLAKLRELAGGRFGAYGSGYAPKEVLICSEWVVGMRGMSEEASSTALPRRWTAPTGQQVRDNRRKQFFDIAGCRHMYSAHQISRKSPERLILRNGCMNMTSRRPNGGFIHVCVCARTPIVACSTIYAP